MASFRDQIHAYAGTGGFVTRAQERALLRIGTSGYGLGYEDARGAVFDAAAADSLVLESAVEDTVADYLHSRADRSGRISRAGFRSATELYRSRARGLLGPEQAASRVKDLMIRRGLSASPTGLVFRNRRWFNRVPPPAQEAAEAPLPIVSAAAVRAPVEATLQAWAAAFNAGDVAGVLALYAPEALLLATAAPDPRRGRAAMRSYFDRLMTAQSASVRFGSTLAIDGTDPATAGGLYEFRYTDPARGPVVVPSRFSYVVTRAGAGELGQILQHHSSAMPFDGASGCPV
ncbi:MAG: nuclear transport factor 2 family protein [Thalassobaculum sp.]|uniref:nuclear transport factor 2 family protein n=3 Tax=Thalassobaculum sp. TaxID=2022740 RepID=UPI0032EC4D29